MQYVINATSIVVHESVCGHGPMSKRSDPSLYEPMPAVLLDYLPNKLLCTFCCGKILMLRAKGLLPTPPSQVPESGAA